MAQVSIVIRTFNEEQHLPQLFAALQRQSLQDFEIVVVDSGSFDHTLEIAEAHADRLVRIASHDFTFGYSLNAGIRASSGNVVAICSAHTVPAGPEWLAALVAPFSDPQVAMVYGRQMGRVESKLAEARDFTRCFGNRAMRLRPPDYYANNANSAIRRQFWREHPFDESLPGLEDAEWARFWIARGFQVLYEPAAALFHIHTETWPQVRRRYYREAQAARHMGLRAARHLPGIWARESWWLLGDLAAAARAGRPKLGIESLRFRWNKAHGTTAGILSTMDMTDARQRQAAFYTPTYSAFTIQGPGRAEIRTLPLPEPRPGEALIRVAFQGICATDLEILDGNLGYYKSGLAKYPIVPGHEFAGTVAAVGARVRDLEAGDRVVVECIQGCGTCECCRAGNWIGCHARTEVGVMGRDGGYGEYMVTPAQFVHKLPPGVPLLLGSLCEPLAVVLKGLRRLNRIRSPARFAVVGAGPIGHLAARVLQQRSASVTVFDRNSERLQLFENSPIERETDLRRFSQFDVLIEATGDPDALEQMLHGSPAGATLLLLGLPYAQRAFSFETVVGFDKTVIGSVGSEAEDFAAATRLVQQLDLRAFQQHIVPFVDVFEALAVARSRRYLKVIVKMDTAQATVPTAIGKAAGM